MVHNIFGPAMEHQGVMKRSRELNYRGTKQTAWQFFPDEFYKQLDLYGRW